MPLCAYTIGGFVKKRNRTENSPTFPFSKSTTAFAFILDCSINSITALNYMITELFTLNHPDYFESNHNFLSSVYGFLSGIYVTMCLKMANTYCILQIQHLD